MKLKTVVIMFAIALPLFALVLFLLNPENQRALTAPLVLFGYRFSLIYGLVASLIVAMTAPSLYFTSKHLKLARQTRGLQKTQGANDAGRSRIAQARALLAHHRWLEVAPLLAKDESPEADLLRAHAQLGLGEAEAAADAFRLLFDERGDVEAGYGLAQALKTAGRSPEPALKDLIERCPKEADAAYGLLLTHYLEDRDWPAAVALIDRMESLGVEVADDRWLGCRYEWARALDQTDRKTMEIYQQITKRAPDFVPAYLAIGEAHMAMGAEEKAFEVYESAFEQTGHPVFLDRLENYYLDQGRPEDALQVYRQLLVKAETPMIRFLLGRLHFRLEMLDESLALLEPLRGQLGDQPGYLRYMAELEARRGRFDEAMADSRSLWQALGFEGENFVCDACKTRHAAWRARCGHCGRWNAITLQAGQVDAETIPANPISY